MDTRDPEHAPVTPPRRRPWTRSLLLGFVILACGAAIGGVGAAVALQQDHDRSPRRSGRGPEGLLQKMQEEYKLTDAQAQQLDTVLREHWERLSAIRAEVQPRVDAEFEALRREVEAVLTPEQAAQWREEFERKRQHWRSRSENANPPRRP